MSTLEIACLAGWIIAAAQAWRLIVASARRDNAEQLLKESANALESEIESERSAMWYKIQRHFD